MDFKNVNTGELIDFYKKIDEFLKYLEKEKQGIEKNNPKNVEIFKAKLEELEKEYATYQDQVSNELKKRYEKAVKKTENKIKHAQLNADLRH